MKMEVKEREWLVWNIRVPAPLDRNLERYLRRNSYATKAEFIREAVRRMLREEEGKLKFTEERIE